jgi:hydrogenase maturation protease
MSFSLQEIDLRPGESVLVYGVGNVGRQDDGIGIRLVESLETDARNACSEGDGAARPTFEANYQLGIEDALLLSVFDVVLFLDASCERISTVPFSVRPVVLSEEIAFTTHAMGFSSVLSICEELYGRRPRAFLVAVSGYEWGISEELSPRARVNMDEAFTSLSLMLRACCRPQGASSRAVG